jgi:hypothetical protein
LFERDRNGTTTPKDRLVINAIGDEVAYDLEKLVRRFNDRKAWLKRRLEAEARARRRRADDPARRPAKPAREDDEW